MPQIATSHFKLRPSIGTHVIRHACRAMQVAHLFPTLPKLPETARNCPGQKKVTLTHSKVSLSVFAGRNSPTTLLKKKTGYNPNRLVSHCKDASNQYLCKNVALTSFPPSPKLNVASVPFPLTQCWFHFRSHQFPPAPQTQCCLHLFSAFRTNISMSPMSTPNFVSGDRGAKGEG